MSDSRPKIRPLSPQPARVQGRPVLLLQDPLQLADKAVFIPQALAPVLAYCDGTRTLRELRASLMIRAGIQLSIGDLERIVGQFDEALLLENDRSAAAQQAALDDYRAAPFRPARLAGSGYPDHPEALGELLDDYIEALPGEALSDGDSLRGLVSPHIDYERGGPVYAQVWRRSEAAVREADLVIILGTDHNGGNGRITLTRQSYSTPCGVLPTDSDVVDAIAQAVGEEAAFEEELNHLGEHSIELAAVWMQHVRGGEPCPVVPILMGSFHHFVQGEADPTEDPTITNAVRALRSAIDGRPALVVAAADLAHIGPAFGDPQPVDGLGKARLKSADDELIATICTGDAEAFFQVIRGEGDRRNVCGLPPIYLMLRLLENARGEQAGYDRCPADPHGTSFVSICGVVLE